MKRYSRQLFRLKYSSIGQCFHRLIESYLRNRLADECSASHTLLKVTNYKRTDIKRTKVLYEENQSYTH